MGQFFVLSQIFAVLTYILLCLTYFIKERKYLLFVYLISVIANAISLLFLQAWAGFAMICVVVLRVFVFMMRDKYGKNPNKINWIDYLILAFFIATVFVGTALTYSIIWDIFPMLATLALTVATWQKNAVAYSVLGAFGSAFWLVYYVIIFSPFSIGFESVLLLLTIVSIFAKTVFKNKLKKKLKNNKKRYINLNVK